MKLEMEATRKQSGSYVERLLKDRQSGWMPIHVLAESSFCERKVELMLKFGYKPTYHATRGFRNHAESAREWCRATQEGILEALSKGVGVHAREVRLAEPSLKLKGIVDQLETYGKRGKAVANAIGEERKVHNCEHVYMTISGGRKDMSIMMALVAQVAGVDGVYHIIHKNVAKYNVMLERMRHDISELAKSGNPRSYYEARLGDFEQLMFPDLADLSIIRLPILPYPRSHLVKLLDILDKGGTTLEIELATIQALKRTGIIAETRGKLIPTDVSKKIARAMRKAIS